MITFFISLGTGTFGILSSSNRNVSRLLNMGIFGTGGAFDSSYSWNGEGAELATAGSSSYRASL